MTKLFKLLRNERGATAIEYGLIAALIAVAIFGISGRTRLRLAPFQIFAQRCGEPLALVFVALGHGLP